MTDNEDKITMITKPKKIEIAKWLLDPDSTQDLPDDLKDLENRLGVLGLKKIYEEIELPLVEALTEIHERGVLVDQKKLAIMQKQLKKKLAALEEKIYAAAGKAFNINSPKQLGEILFDILKLKPKGRTKGGARSTNAAQLELMRGEQEIVSLILEYRELFKMQSTYVMPLLELSRVSKDGRIRTTYLQTSTATGRLSSENPNLQNIPTGTELAKQLRSAFVAGATHTLVSLDYSQIELRVVAAVSGDSKMIEAFKNDVDIHKLTASQVLNIPFEEVTKEQRQTAKTLNFGVLYGMGPQAFARATGMNYAQAEQFINEYFSDFSGIKAWHEKTIAQAEQSGYVENLNGRKRFLPNIISPNQRLAAEARRAAINMPIQSLAADIIKLAMIAVRRELPQIPLILSIHDELVFEVPDDMLKEEVPKLKNLMEAAYALPEVVLKVDVATGKNWGEIS